MGQNRRQRMEELQRRLERCERWNRRLAAVLAFGLVGGIAVSATSLRASAPPPSSMRLTELVIVDDNGVERARLGGNLPEAVIDGQTRSRGDKAAGLLLYDAKGQERGGYVTFA